MGAVREKLKTLLEQDLTTQERGFFEPLWQTLLKGHRILYKEKVVVEKRFAKISEPAPKPKAPKVMSTKSPDVQETTRFKSLASFLAAFPKYNRPDSKPYRVISEFFDSGGEVLEIQPQETP